MQNNEGGTVTAGPASIFFCRKCGEKIPEIEQLKIELASYQSAFRRIDRLLKPETNPDIIKGTREYLLTARSVRESLLIEPEMFPVEVPNVATMKKRLEEWESFRQDFQSIEYHSEGMGCGIEDRGITDRYEACEHGWERAMERVAEILPEENNG